MIQPKDISMCSLISGMAVARHAAVEFYLKEGKVPSRDWVKGAVEHHHSVFSLQMQYHHYRAAMEAIQDFKRRTWKQRLKRVIDCLSSDEVECDQLDAIEGIIFKDVAA